MGGGGLTVLVSEVKRFKDCRVFRSFGYVSQYWLNCNQQEKMKKGRTLDKVSVLVLTRIGLFLKFLHLMSYLNVELASQKSMSTEKFDCI